MGKDDVTFIFQVGRFGVLAWCDCVKNRFFNESCFMYNAFGCDAS